jgi:hypothetical protein
MSILLPLHAEESQVTQVSLLYEIISIKKSELFSPDYIDYR